jgi:hypothetical protein
MLKQNQTLFAQYPCRMIGGVFAGERTMFGRGDRRNFHAGEGIDGDKAGIPNGHLAPSSWLLPLKPGGMSAYVGTNVTFTVGDLLMAAGRNIDGATSITFTVPDAALQLVVSATGTTSVTFSTSGNLAGALQASGSTSVTFTIGTATLGAIINATAATTMTFTGAATIKALGNMEGDVTTFTELSPENLALAVANLQIDGEYTLSDILKILVAVAAGKSDIDTSGANPVVTFRDLNDTLDRITATMAGSERATVTIDVS